PGHLRARLRRRAALSGEARRTGRRGAGRRGPGRRGTGRAAAPVPRGRRARPGAVTGRGRGIVARRAAPFLRYRPAADVIGGSGRRVGAGRALGSGPGLRDGAGQGAVTGRGRGIVAGRAAPFLRYRPAADVIGGNGSPCRGRAGPWLPSREPRRTAAPDCAERFLRPSRPPRWGRGLLAVV